MAADAAIGSKITQALKAGSGVNISELATSLAEAESMAQIDGVTKRKEETAVSISGYAVLKSAVTTLKSSLSSLQDKDSMLTKSVFTSNTNKTTAVISAQTNATAGTTKLEVTSMARPQQNAITDDGNEFTSLTSSLAGSNFTINLKVPHNGSGSGTTVTVSDRTPQGVIDAVNSVTATTGVKARAGTIGATGPNFKIVLEGKEGAANSFAFSSSLSGSSELEGGAFNDKTRTAQNLVVEINGLAFARNNNSPSDLIAGVQLNIKQTGDTNIVVSESADSLETSLNSMVEAYNNLIKLTDYLTGESNEEDEIAGSLSKDRATVNGALNKARSLINLTSATSSNGFGTLRNIGINTKLGGEIALNAKVYAAAIKTNFSDVRTMLTGDTNDQTANSVSAKGLALDMSIILDSVTSDAGSITTKESNVQKEIVRYEEQLIALQERFEGVKVRYLKQFAAMETLVQRNKNTGNYLTSQFEAMQNSNK
jgi:flagellar hook-associated protein 2